MYRIEERLMSAATDDLRVHLHGMWASVAPSWEQHADYVEARGAALTAAMLERSAPQPGERVLELACGPGGLGIAAARLVAPGGEVVLSDVAAEMTAIAARRAGRLANVTTLVLDLERIDQPDASYDLALCREGLMFVPDPARAAREIHRVLRPGGRATIAVWGPRERNPWLGVILDAASAQLGRPVPPPGIPHPFSLAGDGQVADVLAEAGFEVTIEEVALPMRVGSFAEWWERTSALAGPLARVLASLPDDAAAALRGRVREAVRAYEKPNGLEFPGLTLLATARRA
jgi:ubiquinone/menaquinone biosynthesis C-methylase UbiE